MGSALNLIGRIQLSAGADTSVVFNNIPQSFTDLKIIGTARITTDPNGYAARGPVLLDCGKNKKVIGFSTDTTQAEKNSNFVFAAAKNGVHAGMIGIAASSQARANGFSSIHATIMNYTNPAKCAYLFRSVSHQSVVLTYEFRDNDSFGGGTIVGEGTIDSITIRPAKGLTFSQYTEFWLYGVA
jgi:hypothetical protein